MTTISNLLQPTTSLDSTSTPPSSSGRSSSSPSSLRGSGGLAGRVRKIDSDKQKKIELIAKTSEKPFEWIKFTVGAVLTGVLVLGIVALVVYGKGNVGAQFGHAFKEMLSSNPQRMALIYGAIGLGGVLIGVAAGNNKMNSFNLANYKFDTESKSDFAIKTFKRVLVGAAIAAAIAVTIAIIIAASNTSSAHLDRKSVV